MPIQCRTCSVTISNPNAINVFEKEYEEVLQNIEVITGIRIKEDQNMPKHICTCCHWDLHHSIAFRERCLRTETVLQSAKPIKENILELPSEDANSKTEENVMDKSNTVSLSQRLNQRRSPRIQTQNSKTPKQILIENKKKIAIVSWPSPITKVESNEDETFYFLDTGLDECLTSVKTTGDGDTTFLKHHGKLPTHVSSKKIRNYGKPPVDARLFMCDLCGYQSSLKKNLNIHILRHKGEKNFECVDCGTKYYSETLLKLHIRVKHQGEKTSTCKYCGQRFNTSSARYQHEKVRHIRDYKYECKICDKKYLTKSDLDRHGYVHTGLKPFRCDLCNVAFPRKPGLRIHCRTKQHQKREKEAQNSQHIVNNEVTNLEPLIIEPLVDASDENIMYNDVLN